MNLDHYRHLYRSSRSAKQIASDYLNVPVAWLEPLSISHGVDFDHEVTPQDATNCEPLHWCYNESIYRRVRGTKPGVRLPHPWLMLEGLGSAEAQTPRNGSLLVGPPTSDTNDSALARLLARQNVHANAILLKDRASETTNRSRTFWEGQGVSTVTARAGEAHLQDLRQILSGFAEVILPVFSSVGVLAAAAGCRVRLVRPYAHCSYSPRRLDLEGLARSPIAKALVRAFATDDVDAARSSCRKVLGSEFLLSREALVSELQTALQSLDAPLHVPAASSQIHRKILATVSRVTGRTDFLKHGLLRAARFKLVGNQNEIVWKKVDMIDAIENGLSPENCTTRPLRLDESGVKTGRGADE
jgi:hypothetical protein